MREGETGYLCSDGVLRTKQELFARMPLLRFEQWGLYLIADEYVWLTEEERARVQG